LRRYDEDPLYRTLFERTGQLFATQLKKDMAAMQDGRRVSLCAKWCPLLYHSFDRRTLICESIARWLFPAALPEFTGVTERDYAYRVRDKLRKTLSELKEYMKSPERLMCQDRWEEIRYRSVPATSMKLHAKQFEKHDPVRFQEYLGDLESKKVRAKTGALQPHQLLKAVQSHNEKGELNQDCEKILAQAQWEALVEKTRCSGVLKDCIAICDVSGSMTCSAGAGFSCMDVAVSMSLLLAEVACGSSARCLITFHENPQIMKLPPSKKLEELSRFALGMNWGGSTNFNKVFDMLLRMEHPPQKIFVFSDMQFACAGGNGTNFQRAQALYAERGVPMPDVVFWNLSAHSGSPAVAGEKGVTLVSGFSAALLRQVLEAGSIDPVSLLCKALSTELMSKPRVVYEAAEAMELFSGPCRSEPAWETSGVEAEKDGKTETSEGLESGACCKQRKPKHRKNQISESFGSLKSKEAIAAFLGKEGCKVKALRKILWQQVKSQLGVETSLWLDVKTKTVPPPHFEIGDVQVTIQAKLSKAALAGALSAVRGQDSIFRPQVALAIQSAALRAERPKPKRRRLFRPRRHGATRAFIPAEDVRVLREIEFHARKHAQKKHGSRGRLSRAVKRHRFIRALTARRAKKMTSVIPGLSAKRQQHRQAAARKIHSRQTGLALEVRYQNATLGDKFGM